MLKAIRELKVLSSESDHINVMFAEACAHVAEEEINRYAKWVHEYWFCTRKGWVHQGDFYRNEKPIKSEKLIEIFKSLQP